MVVFSRYLLAFMVLSSAPALAYEGLTAPAHDDAPSGRAYDTEKHGYPGLTTGAPPPAAAAIEEPVPQPVAKQKAAPPPPPQYTPAKQYTSSPGDTNVVIHDLGMASALYAPRQPLKMPDVDFSSVKHSRIKGQLPMPYIVNQKITLGLASISDRSLPREERDKKAKELYKSLSETAEALRMQQRAPDSLYKTMKLSDEYIREEKEGAADALSQLDAALDKLRPLQ